MGGYRDLIAAARASGFQNLPDPIASIGAPLVTPASGNIDDTQANRSEGALLIVASSKSLALPHRPLVIATGGALTDVADAYLVDPTVTERVVVVSSLGSTTSTGGGMGSPNGNGDPWADFIVASRFRYVQVSAWYDQLTDVSTDKVVQLPNNALGAWIASKQPNLWQWSPASDQVSVLAVGVPSFATSIERVSPAGAIDGSATSGPRSRDEPEWVRLARHRMRRNGGHDPVLGDLARQDLTFRRLSSAPAAPTSARQSCECQPQSDEGAAPARARAGRCERTAAPTRSRIGSVRRVAASAAAAKHATQADTPPVAALPSIPPDPERPPVP